MSSDPGRARSADGPREPISRGVGARQRVLRAALQVLDEHGLPGFTMEAVARRAGASKATLYRHWPTVGALMVDAMDATFQPFPAPDTGSVETDVAQLLRAFVTLLERTPFPRLLAAFMDAAERDPTLASLHAHLTHRRREPLLIALTRAQKRGQLPAQLDPELTTDLLTAPFFYRRFVAHRPVPASLVDDVVAQVLGAQVLGRQVSGRRSVPAHGAGGAPSSGSGPGGSGRGTGRRSPGR